MVFLIILVFENSYSQDSKPDAALNTIAGSVGISDVDSQMLLKEVRSKLDVHYRLVSDQLFDQAYEKWEDQIQSEEQCGPGKCVRWIQDTLQIERLFSFSVMRSGNLTQLNIALSRLDDTLSETINCDGCNPAQLLKSIRSLVFKIAKKDLGKKAIASIEKDSEPSPQPAPKHPYPEEKIEQDDGWPWWYWALGVVALGGLASLASGSSDDSSGGSSSSGSSTCPSGDGNCGSAEYTW
jgi:hypothetical protein